MDKNVEYREVEGFPAFKVGSDGSVWSCLTHVAVKGRRGSMSSIGEWHKLNPSRDGDGYLIVTLRNGKKQKTGKVHVMVTLAFHGPKPKPGWHAAHYPDRSKTNNAANNLIWVPPQTNSDHMQEHGTVLRGEDSPVHHLTEDAVRSIRRERANGTTTVELAKKYHTSTSNISCIVLRQTWKHVE